MSKFRGLLTKTLVAGGLALLTAGFSPSLAGAAFGPPSGPTSPPFWQCPAVGKSTSCAFLVDVTDSGNVVYQDSSQEFYDLGGDDEMVAVQNDSSTPLSSIHLGVEGSGDNLFGFEGDGLCSPGVGAVPSGCPFGPGGNNEDPYDYYGPGMAFAPGYTSDQGTVEFTPALQRGQYAYFGLDSPFFSVVIPAGGNDYLTTALTGGTPEDEPQVTAPAPTNITDQATLVGPHKEGAEGTIEYKVYSDPACTKEVTGGNATPAPNAVAAGVIPASKAVGAALATNAIYYWQATFKSNDTNLSDPTGNSNAVTACGAETMAFGTPPVRPQIGVSTTLSGGGQSGPSITVLPNTQVTDTAAITGTEAGTATGVVTYTVFADAGCTQQLQSFPVGTDIRSVAGGSAGASGSVSLPLGTYYFRATYSGDETHAPAQSTCGGEVLTVANPVPPPPPNGLFFPVGNPQFNARTGQIVVLAQFPAPGTATSTGVVQQGATLARAGEAALIREALAEAARHRSKKCKRGFVKKGKKCLNNAPVVFGTTVQTIPAPGTYSIVINPSGKVLKALKAGKKLNVVISTTFQNRAGGAPVTHLQSVFVKLKLKRHGHSHRRR
ncbi:MAG: Ig-like domain-containing protein [Solirubrobacterales bacterium]